MERAFTGFVGSGTVWMEASVGDGDGGGAGGAGGGGRGA